MPAMYISYPRRYPHHSAGMHEYQILFTPHHHISTPRNASSLKSQHVTLETGRTAEAIVHCTGLIPTSSVIRVDYGNHIQQFIMDSMDPWHRCLSFTRVLASSATGLPTAWVIKLASRSISTVGIDHAARRQHNKQDTYICSEPQLRCARLARDDCDRGRIDPWRKL